MGENSPLLRFEWILMEKRWLEDKAYVERCFAGKELFGDSFAPQDIERWYELESHAYAQMSGSGKTTKEIANYGYHEMNKHYGYRYLPDIRYERVLGFGSGYGDDMLPVLDRCGEVFIIEPGDVFWEHHLGEKNVSYHKPKPSGDMPFEDSAFDLILCFSALHHVANVSKIISEFARVLRKDGWLIIREPTTSMGDWFAERPGTTSCERGIPADIMNGFILGNGLTIRKQTPCDFAPWNRLVSSFGISCYSSRFATRVDAVFSRIFSFNRAYYAKNVFRKFRPGARFYVCAKDA